MIKRKYIGYLCVILSVVLTAAFMLTYCVGNVKAEDVVIPDNTSFSAGAIKAVIETTVESVADETLISVTEIDTVITTTSVKTYTEQDLWALAHLIHAEGGSEACSDTLRYYVGSVVLNRMNHWYYPDTIEGVIFDKGQYSCTWNGSYYKEPSEKCWAIAKELLETGSVLPENVVFQASFKQGDGVYERVDGEYFCYWND